MKTPDYRWYLSFTARCGSRIDPYLHYLKAADIPYRVHQNELGVHLWVADKRQKRLALQWFRKWERGEMPVLPHGIAADFAIGKLFWHRCRLVLGSMLLSVLGYLVVQFNWLHVLSFLTFQDSIYLSEQRTMLSAATSDFLRNFQYWRLISPVFLHFSILHLIFNLIWLWEFGWRIESFSHLIAGLIIVFCAVVSCLAQYWWHPENLFGGMSGVVYGFLGFCLVWNRIRTKERIRLMPGAAHFLIGWMILCATGLLSYIGAANIGNAAHIAGFLGGGLLAAVTGLCHPPICRQI